jgi:peroxiredoxin
MLRRWSAALLLACAIPGAAWAVPAKDFTLRDLDGHDVSLASYRGKVVVLTFWASWCGPCRAELPQIQKLYAKHGKDGLVVLAVSSDDPRNAARVKAYVGSQGFTFPVMVDATQDVTRHYDPPRTLPTVVVIGPDFEIAESHTGYAPGDERRLEALIQSLLPKS